MNTQDMQLIKFNHDDLSPRLKEALNQASSIHYDEVAASQAIGREEIDYLLDDDPMINKSSKHYLLDSKSRKASEHNTYGQQKVSSYGH